MRCLIPLAAIEVFVWSILLLSTFLISKVAFAINLGNATLIQRVATQTARVVVSGAIILIWLLVWKRVTDTYFWRTISRRKASA
jgi:hypothetical protein